MDLQRYAMRVWYHAFCIVFFLIVVTSSSVVSNLKIPLRRQILQVVERVQNHSSASAATHSTNVNPKSRPGAEKIITPDPHPDVFPSTSPGTVALKGYRSLVYTGRIGIGTPLQDFDVVFDTGSADTWVFSRLSAYPLMPWLQYYDRHNSSTYRSVSGHAPNSWQIRYGTGACTGDVSRDNVRFAGLTIEGQVFAEARNYTHNFRNRKEPLDGILGLAFRRVAVDGASPVIDSLYLQGLIPYRAFSFYFNPNVSETSGSYFYLGGPRMEHAPKGMTWLPSGAGMWFVDVDAVSVNDVVRSDVCQRGRGRKCMALMDTGSSFVAFPSHVFKPLMNSIVEVRPDCAPLGGSAHFVCSRLSLEHFPTVSFTLRDQVFRLRPKDYFSIHNGILGFTHSHGENPDVDIFVLGDVFLKTYYTVFDMDRTRIGIANPMDVLFPTITQAILVTVITCGALASGFVVVNRRNAALDVRTGTGANQPIMMDELRSDGVGDGDGDGDGDDGDDDNGDGRRGGRGDGENISDEDDDQGGMQGLRIMLGPRSL